MGVKTSQWSTFDASFPAKAPKLEGTQCRSLNDRDLAILLRIAQPSNDPRAVNAIVEFGTWNGDVAYALAHCENEMAHPHIYTFDSCQEFSGGAYLPMDKVGQAWRDTSVEDRISFNCLSNLDDNLFIEPLRKFCSLVYIDSEVGNKYLLAKLTLDAITLLNKSGTIVWRGYNSDPVVRDFLEHLPCTIEHVVGSDLCFCQMGCGMSWMIDVGCLLKRILFQERMFNLAKKQGGDGEDQS